MNKLIPLLLLTASIYAQEDCTPSYCLGPNTVQGNAPVRPYTCDGDFEIGVSAIYWKATQDGMTFGIKNESQLVGNPTLVDAEYLNPSFAWNFGGKVKLLYASPCDGWELSAKYTNFQGKAEALFETDWATINNPSYYYSFPLDGEILEVFWTAFPRTSGYSKPLASEMANNWVCDFHILDCEIGRPYWQSQKLVVKPKIGLKLIRISQSNLLELHGGDWALLEYPSGVVQPALNGYVSMKNQFEGIGPLGGIDLDWKLSCGWSLYSSLGVATAYGTFDIRHEESFREAQAPFAKTKLLETKNSFKKLTGILDAELGVQKATLIWDSKYALTLQLGWEGHLFFHQNQMWKINRNRPLPTGFLPNNTGQTIFEQLRGTLSTQGITFTVKFDF